MELQDVTTKRVVIPSKALKALILKQASGLVTIFDPTDESVFWHLYFSSGKLQYATSGMGRKERLTYLLKQLFPKSDFPIPNGLSSEEEYLYIRKLLGSSKLSAKQVKQVLYYLTQEAIAQVLSIPRAALQYDPKTLLPEPAILSLSIGKMLRPLQTQIKDIVKLRTAIGSPFQRLQLLEADQDVSQPDLNLAHCISFEGLNVQLAEKRTLYEVSLEANQSILTFGNLIKPMVRKGRIETSPYQAKPSQPKTLVACIDDSKATQRIVKLILEASGYEVIGLTDPAQALSTFVQQRPAVILMDINMPDINGYELCRMLNQSNMLKDIPVIMLTGRDGLLDRMRARLVGSTDYIPKPFQPQDLVQLVRSYTEAPKSKGKKKPSLPSSETTSQLQSSGAPFNVSNVKGDSSPSLFATSPSQLKLA